MIYVAQASESELQVNAIDWISRGGKRYIAIYPSGQACIYGPYSFGSPNKPFFEVCATKGFDYSELGAAEVTEMRDKMRADGLMRADDIETAQELPDLE